MKIRNGFVSNSSSSSFIIKNKTNDTLTLKDFVIENPQLVEEFNTEYDWYSFTQDEMIQCSINRGDLIVPGLGEFIFGDEDGDVLGHVFDYILRDGGESESFEWWFNEHCR